jgi:ribosomal protein L11 methyltransferase
MAWRRASVVVAGNRAEALAGALESAGAVATDFCDAHAGTAGEEALFAEPGAEPRLWARCRVSALFPESVDASQALANAAQACDCLWLEPPAVDLLADEDWVRLTQAQFGPIRASKRLWIVPTWHEPPEQDAVNLMLDPGAAFGTGSHPTTRLCLAWLDREVRGGESVLDYGCGSGILAIAAMKLGAGRATAVDIDPLALEAARYNAHSNDVVLEVLSADAPLTIEADITVANILANPLRMLAALLAAHTVPGGRLVLSGILAGQQAQVRAAYARWFDLGLEGEDAGWIALAGPRRG